MFGIRIDRIAREGIVRIFDEARSRQRRGIRIGHEFVGHRKACGVEILYHEQRQIEFHIEAVALDIELIKSSSVVSHDDYPRIVVDALLAQIIKPLAELDEGRHIRMIVGNLFFCFQRKRYTVDGIALDHVNIVSGVVDPVGRDIIGFLQKSERVRRIVGHHKECVIGRIADFCYIRKMCQYGI